MRGVRSGPTFGAKGFSLVEIIVSLVILGFLGVAGAESIQAILRGYTMARSSDEVAQKAQMALNRMTIELSYIDPTQTGTTNGTATSITYAAAFPTGTENHTIALSGTQITYSVTGAAAQVLLDDVAANGLTFSYYTSYNDASPAATMSAATKMIGINLVMHGESWVTGVNKTFTTRVLVNKY